MTLFQEVELALEKEKRTMTWLATELDRTLEGLKLSLKNETIKYSDLKKLLTIINIPSEKILRQNNLQKVKGNYNTQISGGIMMASEPELYYEKITTEGLQKQIQLLESQIADKNKIIELLSKK